MLLSEAADDKKLLLGSVSTRGSDQAQLWSYDSDMWPPGGQVRLHSAGSDASRSSRDASSEPPRNSSAERLPVVARLPVVEADDEAGSPSSSAGRPPPDEDRGVREVPASVEAMFATVDAAQGRCGLIAGFTYYELSRQTEASVDRLPAYTLALLVAFSLAVTSTALATLVRVYLRCVHFSEWGAYATKVRGVASVSYVCFVAASLVWIVAMSMMGLVYNPSHSDSYVEIRNVMLFPWYWMTLFPFFVLLPTALLCLLYVCWLHALAKTLKETPSSTHCKDTTSQANLAQQCIVTSKQAADSTMYLLGFTGASLARYSTMLAMSAVAHIVVGNIFFWLFTVTGAAALAFAMVCGTHTSVVLATLTPAIRETVFRRIACVSPVFRFAFRFGKLCVFLSGALIAWGCTQCCQTKFDNRNLVQIDGVCYAAVAPVTLTIGGAGILVWMALSAKVRLCLLNAEVDFKEEVVRCRAADMPLPNPATNEIGAISKMMQTWSSQASLFSGFVYYNLACFDTDILHGPITGDVVSGVTAENILFLCVTMGAFSLGMAIVAVAGTVQFKLETIPARAVQQHFARRLRPVVWWMGLLRRLAMYCFMASFALIGVVKMYPRRLEPAIITLVGLFLLTSRERLINEQFRAAMVHEGSPLELDEIGDGPTHLRIQSQMSVMASHALFMGAFCYNGINFLFRPEAELGPAYVVTLAICFVMSLAIVLNVSSISSMLVRLEGYDVQRERFAKSLAPHVRLAYVGYKNVPLVFMGGIILMGSVKLWLWNTTSATVCRDGMAPRCQQVSTPDNALQQQNSLAYGWIISLGGLMGLLGSWLFIQLLESRAAKAHTEDESIPAAQLSRSRSQDPAPFTSAAPEEVDPFEDVREDAELRTTGVLFQTGNVFYEVLFTTINPSHVAQNYVYLGFSVLTLTLGCIAVVLGGSIAIWMHDLRTKGAKSIFAREVQPCVSLLFYLYHFSLCSWLVAMMASSAVKYDRFWYFSCSTSMLAMLAIHAGWVTLVMRQRGLRRAAQPGCGVRGLSLQELMAPAFRNLRGFIALEDMTPSCGEAGESAPGRAKET